MFKTFTVPSGITTESFDLPKSSFSKLSNPPDLFTKLTVLPNGSLTHRSTSSFLSLSHSITIKYSAFLGVSDFFVIGLININAIINKNTKPSRRLNNISVKPILFLYLSGALRSNFLRAIYSPGFTTTNVVFNHRLQINPVTVV